MDAVNLFAALLILVNCVLGILFSSLIIFVHFTEKQEKTSFNLICLTRSINNVTVLLFDFLLLSFPVALLSTNFYPITIETLIIITTVNLYLVNEYQTILIALNRFVAIFFPLYYSKICSVKVTAVILGIMYVERGYASGKLIYTMMNYNCEVYFSLETFGTGITNRCPTVNSPNNDATVIGTLFFFSLTILLNLATFAKILKFYFDQNMDTESVVLARKNIRLFFQTILQDSLFFVDVMFTFKLSSLSDHRFWFFISACFVWESIHTLDGLIMLMFSDRLSFLKARFSRKSVSVSGRGASDFRAQTSSVMPEIG